MHTIIRKFLRVHAWSVNALSIWWCYISGKKKAHGNITRHTANIMVLWPNTEQLLVFHISDLMLITRWTTGSNYPYPDNVDKWWLSIWAAQIFIPEASHAQILIVPHGPRTVWNTLKGPVWGPYNARVVAARDPYLPLPGCKPRISPGILLAKQTTDSYFWEKHG